MSRPEALRRARQLRTQLRDTGDVFTQAQFRELIAERCNDLAPSALAGLVEWAADRVDKDSTREGDDPQMSLHGFEVEGDYKLGDGDRIAKRFARRDHLLAALALSDNNRKAVDEANDRFHEEVDRLLPYLVPGVTKANAIMAYITDHPQLNNNVA